METVSNVGSVVTGQGEAWPREEATVTTKGDTTGVEVKIPFASTRLFIVFTGHTMQYGYIKLDEEGNAITDSGSDMTVDFDSLWNDAQELAMYVWDCICEIAPTVVGWFRNFWNWFWGLVTKKKEQKVEAK